MVSFTVNRASILFFSVTFFFSIIHVNIHGHPTATSKNQLIRHQYRNDSVSHIVTRYQNLELLPHVYPIEILQQLFHKLMFLLIHYRTKLSLIIVKSHLQNLTLKTPVQHQAILGQVFLLMIFNEENNCETHPSSD